MFTSKSRMEAIIYDIQGADTGRKADLIDSIFGLESPSDHAIYQDVRLILANARQGTHKAKERGEITGSKKKPYRQKGTGNARAGSKKSPLWRHGGRIFGPKPRDYGFKLNKKIKVLARKSALTYKAREDKVKVLENFQLDVPKTKEFKAILDNINSGDKKTLVILSEMNPNVYLSGRNLPKSQVITVADLNTYDIVNAEEIIFTEGAVQLLTSRLS